MQGWDIWGELRTFLPLRTWCNMQQRDWALWLWLCNSLVWKGLPNRSCELFFCDLSPALYDFHSVSSPSTALPDLSPPNYRPQMVSVRQHDIQLRWKNWPGYVDPNMQLKYRLQSRESIGGVSSSYLSLADYLIWIRLLVTDVSCDGLSH